MTIKELEKRTGLPRTAIRFYENQGLITPERRENNYREYTQEDALTLEKVKLLRQLSLELETIRALKGGSLSLSQALSRQAEVLEGDRKDLERYAQVCRELSAAQTSYDALEPQPWLEELSQTDLPPTRRVDPAREDGLRGPHPWRRFWARSLDVQLMTAVWLYIQFQVLRWYGPSVYRNSIQTLISLGMAWLLLIVVEPLLLCTWGYTPGKWLMGLQVRRLDGRKPTWFQAADRLFQVLWWGQGLCIPLYREWRSWICYEDCIHGKPLPWEEDTRCITQPLRRGRWVVWAGCVAAVMALSGVSLLYSDVPPYPDAPFTPAQVVENYNFYEQRFSYFDEHISALAPNGSWKTMPAIYQNRNWMELKEERYGEWSSITFETAPDGTVTALQVDFSPKGDPYDNKMDVGWVMNEVLAHLILAADPSGEAQNPLQVNERRRQAYGVCDRLLDAPFQGAGAENRVQGPGGMTVAMEVKECQGYKATSAGDYSVLIQKEPGAGTLTFHITVTIPET